MPHVERSAAARPAEQANMLREIVRFEVRVRGTHLDGAWKREFASQLEPFGPGFFNVGGRAREHAEIEDDEIAVASVEPRGAEHAAISRNKVVHPRIPAGRFLRIQIRIADIVTLLPVQIEKAGGT